jgi:hypothetical protein
MDPQQGGYDAAGRLVCRTCMAAGVVAQANRTIEERDPTSTRNLYGGAAGTLLFGLATCCLSPFGWFYFLLIPMVIVTGGWTILHLLRTPEAKTQLGAGYWAILAMSIVGVIFGFGAILIGILTMIGAGLPQ